MASAHSGSGLGLTGPASPEVCRWRPCLCLLLGPVATMPAVGPSVSCCTFVSVPGSPLLVGCGVPKGLGYSFCHCLQPQPLACQASQGQLLPWGRGDRLRSGPSKCPVLVLSTRWGYLRKLEKGQWLQSLRSLVSWRWRQPSPTGRLPNSCPHPW